MAGGRVLPGLPWPRPARPHSTVRLACRALADGRRAPLLPGRVCARRAPDGRPARPGGQQRRPIRAASTTARRPRVVLAERRQARVRHAGRRGARVAPALRRPPGAPRHLAVIRPPPSAPAPAAPRQKCTPTGSVPAPCMPSLPPRGRRAEGRMPAPLRLAGAGGALPAYAIDGARIVYCDLRLAGAGGALPAWDRAELRLGRREDAIPWTARSRLQGKREEGRRGPIPTYIPRNAMRNVDDRGVRISDRSSAAPDVEVGAALRGKIRDNVAYKRFVDAVLGACQSPRVIGLGIERYAIDEERNMENPRRVTITLTVWFSNPDLGARISAWAEMRRIVDEYIAPLLNGNGGEDEMSDIDSRFFISMGGRHA